MQSQQTCDEEEKMNNNFTIFELETAIISLKNTSPGKDMITNELLKHLNANMINELLYLYNTSWSTGLIPKPWKHSILIPLLKPGKDSKELDSYRPIALLPTIAKLMEKLIANRMHYWLEKNGKLKKFQCGFRKNLSTTDVLLQFDYNIKKALSVNNYTVVIYIDLEGAYDKVWHIGLLNKMKLMNTPSRLYNWMIDYLNERTFQVRIGTCLSENRKFKSGVPQGAILSPILFNIMLSDIPEMKQINIYCYADDITISCSGPNLKEVKQTIQKYINLLSEYFQKWGMSVSEDKTKMQIFTKNKNPSTCTIKLKNKTIPLVKNKKLLGLIIDAPKMTFKDHIEALTINIKKRIDIMKSIASTKWGASTKILKLFYITYVRAKIDYGCVVYANTSSKHLQKLDKLQNRALRLILGALNTSPIISMEVIANIPY